MVLGGNHVHVVSCAIAIAPRIEKDCCMSLADKCEGGSEAIGTSADYQDVNRVFSGGHFYDTSFQKMSSKRRITRIEIARGWHNPS